MFVDFIRNMTQFALNINRISNKERMDGMRALIAQAESLQETSRVPVIADDADILNLDVPGKD